MTQPSRVLLVAVLAFHAPSARGYVGYVVLSNVTQPGTACELLDLTPDGHYVAGACQPAVGQGYGVARWTGFSLEFLSPHPGSNALTYAVSAGGEVAGIVDPPFYSGFHGFGPFSILPQFEGCPFWPVGISGDGARIVGSAGPLCNPTTGNGSLIFESGGYVVPELNGGAAWAISSDGSTVVGGSPAYRWDEGTVTQLGVPGPGERTLATGVSPDGSVVIGTYDADVTGGTDQRQVLWGPNGFMELGASPSWPTATTPPDANGMPIAVVGGHGLLLGAGPPPYSPTLWTAPFGLESLESRLQFAQLPAQNLISATGLSDDGRYVVGSFQVGAFPEEALGFAAYMPQWRTVTFAFFGDLHIDGYVRLQQPDPEPPERIAAKVEFFGTTGGTFASGTTAAPLSDPFPVFEELEVELANLEYATDPLLVWTFEYDGLLDNPIEFTTQFPANTIVPPEEITLLKWDTDLQAWAELQRVGFDAGAREITVRVGSIEAIAHLAIGRTLAACADDIDNDGDGRVDWDGDPAMGVNPDPQCVSAVHRVEAKNNCGLGAELVLLLPLLLTRRTRASRRRA